MTLGEKLSIAASIDDWFKRRKKIYDDFLIINDEAALRHPTGYEPVDQLVSDIVHACVSTTEHYKKKSAFGLLARDGGDHTTFCATIEEYKNNHFLCDPFNYYHLLDKYGLTDTTSRSLRGQCLTRSDNSALHWRIVKEFGQNYNKSDFPGYKLQSIICKWAKEILSENGISIYCNFEDGESYSKIYLQCNVSWY